MWLALDVVIRLVLGLLLVRAGSAILKSVATWRELWLVSYRLLPAPIVPPIARALPAIEVGCGLALLVGASGALLAATLLLSAMTLGVLAALAQQSKLPCGRIGRVGRSVSWHVVLRNLVLTAVGVTVAAHGHVALGLSGHPWWVQSSVLAAIFAGVGGWFAHQRRAIRDRYFHQLLDASRPDARAARDQRRATGRAVDDPVLLGVAAAFGVLNELCPRLRPELVRT